MAVKSEYLRAATIAFNQTTPLARNTGLEAAIEAVIPLIAADVALDREAACAAENRALRAENERLRAAIASYLHARGVMDDAMAAAEEDPDVISPEEWASISNAERYAEHGLNVALNGEKADD